VQKLKYITIEIYKPKCYNCCMLINCTKKLQDELMIKPEKAEVFDSLYSWHANIIKINRRKTIVLVNDASGYVVILRYLKAKDFKSINILITESIKEILIADCIKPEIVDKYLADGGKIAFSKTQNRSLIAKMNKGCEAADVFDEEYNLDIIPQDYVTRKANHWIFTHIDNETYHPNELFYNYLVERFSQPIFSTKALVLNIRLDLKNHDIWRRVIVPLNIHFYELHRVIRAAFDWGYYHLHDFVIYENAEPFLRVLCNEDDLETYQDDEMICLERETKISEYLPKYKSINYTYDFGDNWVHNIEIENVLFDYENNYAVCLEGKANRPPEDVGGEGGYEEFMEIMDDPNHEEYESAKGFYENQHYKGFDIDLVNRQLKHLY